MPDQFINCPYKNQVGKYIDRHEICLTNLDNRVTLLETTVGRLDEIIKRLEALIDKLTGNINKVLVGAFIIPIITIILAKIFE